MAELPVVTLGYATSELPAACGLSPFWLLTMMPPSRAGPVPLISYPPSLSSCYENWLFPPRDQ